MKNDTMYALGAFACIGYAASTVIFCIFVKVPLHAAHIFKGYKDL